MEAEFRSNDYQIPTHPTNRRAKYTKSVPSYRTDLPENQPTDYVQAPVIHNSQVQYKKPKEPNSFPVQVAHVLLQVVCLPVLCLPHVVQGHAYHTCDRPVAKKLLCMVITLFVT